MSSPLKPTWAKLRPRNSQKVTCNCRESNRRLIIMTALKTMKNQSMLNHLIGKGLDYRFCDLGVTPFQRNWMIVYMAIRPRTFGKVMRSDLLETVYQEYWSTPPDTTELHDSNNKVTIAHAACADSWVLSGRPLCQQPDRCTAELSKIISISATLRDAPSQEVNMANLFFCAKDV